MAKKSFASLKKKAMDLGKLSEEAEKANNQQNYDDDRFWKPKRDDQGNCYVELRFLPPPEEEKLPWVKYMDYGFSVKRNGEKKWYFERSLASIGKPDPIAEYNSRLWNDKSGDADDIKARQEDVKKRNRRVNFVANVYIIKDSENPENEGKVFLWRFGKSIFEKIQKAIKPPYPDKEPMNPFDLWKGATFKLKGFTQKKFVKYDDSEFDEPSVFLDGDEDEMEEAFENVYSLDEFIDPANYKTYEELRVKAEKILGVKLPKEPTGEDDGDDDPDDDDPDEDEKPRKEKKKKKDKAKKDKKKSKPDPEPDDDDPDDDSDILSKFNELSDDDDDD